MEEHFGIKYEFDISTIHKRIEEQVNCGSSAYICAPDGNVINMVHHSAEYRDVVNGSMFSICDSGWAPIFIKWIYGIRYRQYCGSDIFFDIVGKRKYRMLFMGTNQRILDALQANLAKEYPEVKEMTFMELPYCNVDEFDYREIAESANKDCADIIWVALGAPKQEIFMSRLKPYLNRGVMIAVGAVFGFYSKLPDVPGRSPQWLQKYHLEFAHRLFTEPKKQIKRCWGIIKTLPKILHNEYKAKKSAKRVD